MTYSYTQISQYLGCPRRYRHRYLDGWQEKDTRAAMLFGRRSPSISYRRVYNASCLGTRIKESWVKTPRKRGFGLALGLRREGGPQW